MINKELKNLEAVSNNRYFIEFDQMIEDNQNYNLIFMHYKFGDIYGLLLRQNFKPFDLRITRDILL